MSSDLPREVEAFTEHVARLVRKHLPFKSVSITGPLELTIENYVIALEDLHRAAHQGGVDDPDAMAVDFVDAAVSARRLEHTSLPLEFAGPKILPRICPISILRGRRPDHFAAQPFVNDTVIMYFVDLNPGAPGSAPLTTEQLIRWGVSAEEVDQLARHNLAVVQPELHVQVYESEEAPAAVLSTGDGYDAARLLLEELHAQLAPRLGRDFLVAIPCRDMFIAFPTEPDRFVEFLKTRVKEDYQRKPYPITASLFLMTMDGVAPWSDAA